MSPDWDEFKALPKSKKPNRNKRKDSKALGVMFLTSCFFIFGIVLFMWVAKEPPIPRELSVQINEEEINNTIDLVQSIEQSKRHTDKVKQDVGNLMNKVLMYDSGKASIKDGLAIFERPNKESMGMLQRALVLASKAKAEAISAMKTPTETQEEVLIRSSGNPIQYILKPVLNKVVDRAVLNVYMNNGDSPVSLALSMESLVAFSIMEYSTYFLDYIGTERPEGDWLDDAYLQRFVMEAVPVLHTMLSFPYAAGNREVPRELEESLTLMLCTSWEGVTPLTSIKKCQKSSDEQLDEPVREGS